jgi:ATPase subunit of ABC transporter with duplicated ATPase domains
MLDEPTNDFDIEILTELEDLLDSYAGTLTDYFARPLFP